jgi:NADPH:quinone reductase
VARKPKLPETMRAAAIERFGGPAVLRLRTLPVPSVGAFEVLIAVHTAGVGSWDPEMRAGRSPSGKTRFPLVLGSDGSGTIAAAHKRLERGHVLGRVVLRVR